MKKEKRKRGRPSGSTIKDPADQRLPHIRVTKEQITKYKQAAEASGQKLSAWVRDTLDKAISK